MFYEWFGCTRRWQGGRRGDASGFTLGWIGNVTVSVSAVVVREDIFFLLSFL